MDIRYFRSANSFIIHLELYPVQFFFCTVSSNIHGNIHGLIISSIPFMITLWKHNTLNFRDAAHWYIQSTETSCM